VKLHRADGQPAPAIEPPVFASAASNVWICDKSVSDPGYVKTPQAQKRGAWISQINQDWRRSEIIIALNAIQREICSINFPRRGLFAQPRPIAVIEATPLDLLVGAKEILNGHRWGPSEHRWNGEPERLSFAGPGWAVFRFGRGNPTIITDLYSSCNLL
jgi:hypothetical protein